jgi:hypothetical protein
VIRAGYLEFFGPSGKRNEAANVSSPRAMAVIQLVIQECSAHFTTRNLPGSPTVQGPRPEVPDSASDPTLWISRVTIAKGAIFVRITKRGKWSQLSGRKSGTKRVEPRVLY